jgi:hypothetical protein
VILVVAYVVGTPEITTTDDHAPDPAIVRDLQEIVQIRERLVANYQVLVSAGRAPDDGHAEIALAEARIDLAREQRQTDQVLAGLQRLVSVQEGRLARAEARVGDRIGPIERDEIRVDVLQARIRLARERTVSERIAEPRVE